MTGPALSRINLAMQAAPPRWPTKLFIVSAIEKENLENSCRGWSEPIFGKGMRRRRSSFQWKKGVFSEEGGGNSVNQELGKDFYRKGNSVKRFGPSTELPDSENWKVAVLIPFPKTDMTGWPGYRTMEMIGGSSASYLARTPCVPLCCTLFTRGGSRRAFRLPGAGGDHFHCTVDPSPGHIRCRSSPSRKSAPIWSFGTFNLFFQIIRFHHTYTYTV